MSVTPYNNSSSSSSSSFYSTSSAMGLPRSTILLSRPLLHCRCDLCTFNVRQNIESSILEPVEPLMIPNLSFGFGWWNVRLPSKLVEPAAQFTNADYVCIDEDVMSFLEEKKVINWCPGLRQLHPIRTTGDGNCLMHAVILATCGIQDSGIVLRRLVYIALVESASNSFRKRWQKEKQRLNENIPGGLQYTPEEWDKEWTMVVNAAEDLRKSTMAYEFLEEMHVFVLANVICRPIIILGESTVRSPLAGDSIEQNNFVGIYLPLLWPPKSCDPNPVVLCFLHNHFQPLISRYKFPSEPKDLLAIPLVTSRLEPLHIHFLLPREESMAHDLLLQYLYTSEVPRKSEDGSSDEAILVAEIYYTSRYYNWEHSDYMYLTENLYTQTDAQKIAQVPSKSNLNYIQSAKLDSPVHQTSHGVGQPKHLAVECCHCKKKHQKSMTTQPHSSMGISEGSLGNRHSSKIQFDKSKIYPDRPESHADCDKIHKDQSTGHLDSADYWNRHLQLTQSKNLAGVGQDGRHLAPQAESIPDNVTIFNTLKKLKSPQQAEGAMWGVSNPEKGRQPGAVGGGFSWGNTDYGFKSKMETQFSSVGPQTPVSQSTKPGNSKSSAAEKKQRKLSDISDADIDYIQQKFTVKTPIYCRSLALLGKQCAKPDCNRFVAEETDFCCSVHANPNPSTKVVATPMAQCTRAGCLNLGQASYGGMCAKCVVYLVYGKSWYDEDQYLQASSGYERSLSKRGNKTPSTHPEPYKGPVVVVETKFKCITDGCKDYGYADIVGMCARCFVQAYTTAFPTSKGSAPPGKMGTERAVEQSNQVKCVTDGCKGLGYTAYLGLCFKCSVLMNLAAHHTQEGTEPKRKAETTMAVEPLTQVQCITEGCIGFGYIAYLGLCPECYIQAYFRDGGTTEGLEHHEDPDTETSVESVRTVSQQQNLESLYSYRYRILSDKSGPVADGQKKYLVIPPPGSERAKHLESGRQKALSRGNTQPLKSFETEEVEHSQSHHLYEKPDSRAIEENFDDWFNKKYPPKVLGDGTFPPEPPISGILPFRNKSVAQDGEEVETKARNDCTKNEESFHSGDKQLAIGKDDGESISSKNMLERSTSKGKVEASKEDLGDDLPPLTAVETSRQSTGSENYGELSSDDLGPVDAVLPCSPESGKGLWTLPSSAPDLVASGDECSDGEEFPKCLSTSCENVAMETVAGGYCVTCHAARAQGRRDAQTSGVAEGFSNQLIKMSTQETVVPCVMEGCCNSAAITEFRLCSACYARQLKASTTHDNSALQLPRQKPISSAKPCVTKTKETSKSSTSSGLTRRAMPCRRTTCDRYGDPVYGGFCSQCATRLENSVMEIDSC